MKKSCLFLDRDGVINRKLPDAYVRKTDEFEFLPGVPDAIRIARQHFDRIVVVTNQQGIAKGIMSVNDLENVHDHMLEGLLKANARLDAIYFCPDLAGPDATCRKPDIGMVLQAVQDFPDIELKHSVIAGDSPADLKLGERCGMFTVLVRSHQDYSASDFEGCRFDAETDSLLEWINTL